MKQCQVTMRNGSNRKNRYDTLKHWCTFYKQ